MPPSAACQERSRSPAVFLASDGESGGRTMAIDADAHGRRAKWPSHIPARGWRDILIRVKDDISRKNLSLIAAGAAFYAFLSIPSAFTALIALYGLIFDPANVERQVEDLRGV